MNKKKLEQIIGEVLRDYKPKKKEGCGCGCNTCHLESKISLNESLTKKPIISEGLKYHLENKLPLHESVYRTGSDKYFALLREARRLYSRNVLNVTGDDEELLRDLNTGEYGIFEGKQVPLDYPLLENEVENPMDIVKIDIPLFIRLLEYAREDAKTDMDLHNLTEKALMASAEGKILTMDDYSFLVPEQEKINEDETYKYDDDFFSNEKKFPMADIVPYSELTRAIYKDWGPESDLWRDLMYSFWHKVIDKSNEHGAPLDYDEKKIINILKKYGVYDKYLPLLHLNEDKAMSSEEYSEYKDGVNMSDVLPYSDLTGAIYQDWGPNSDLWDAVANAALDFDEKKIIAILKAYDVYDDYLPLLHLNEAKDNKKHPPLNKPKRGGSKKFYVYVRDPKTKRIKKVSFGDTTGLKAKINNPKARQAFAKRQRCSDAKDKTKARYWACRLPRYAHLLGLKTTFSGYW